VRQHDHVRAAETTGGVHDDQSSRGSWALPIKTQLDGSDGLLLAGDVGPFSIQWHFTDGRADYMASYNTLADPSKSK